jgi:hypothetical protein
VEPEAAQVVGHAALGELAGAQAQQVSDVLSQVTIGEATGQQVKDEQGREQRSRAWVVEAERRGALVADDRGAVDFLEFGFAQGRVVAQSLNVEKTSVGP